MKHFVFFLFFFFDLERDEVASAAERLRALEMEYELLLRHRMAMLDSSMHDDVIITS